MCAPNIEAGHLSCLDMLTTFTSAAQSDEDVSRRHRSDPRARVSAAPR